MHAFARPSSPDRSPGTRRSWAVLILLCVAQFMVVLDMTVANVALPAIDADLGFAPGDLQWVVSAYLLFTGGLLLLGGRAADLLGHRRTFLTGLLVFTAASLASGLAPTPAALIAARGVQGLGAALLTPSALAIITRTYTGAQRTVALSTWGALASAGAGAGVVLGGMLTTWLSWEWVFLINVPIGAVAAILALHIVPPTPAAAGRRRLDVPGALAMVAGLVVVVYALVGTAEHGWASARTLLLLALAGGLLATFTAVERASAHPLVPPKIWRVRSLTAAATVMLGATGILVGAFFLNSLYLQGVLGASALETGFAFVPLVLAIGIAAHLAPHLLGHAGARAVAVVGLALTTVGALVLAIAPDQASYAADLLPGFVVLGLGIGLVFPAAQVSAMNDVEPDQAGLASGVMSTAHEIGAALGVAVLSAIATAGAGAELASGYGDGFLVAAIAAAALAGLGLLAVPAIRPAAGMRPAPH